jgi:ribosomal protein L16 Arg81 hydroxylase
MQNVIMLTLDELLAPVSLARFGTEFWQNKPLYIPGDGRKAVALAGRSDIYASAHSGTVGIRMSAGYRDRTGRHRQLRISSEQIQHLLSAGLTIQINGLQQHNPELADTLTSLRRSLCALSEGDVAAFLSEKDAGYALHFDALEMFVIQIEGRKHWQYSPVPAGRAQAKNVIWNPVTQQAKDVSQTVLYDLRTPTETGLIEIVLNPGDVLYLPSGVWHTASAVDPSMHLCMSFGPYSFQTLLTQSVLAPLLAESEGWRSVPMPLGAENAASALLSYFDERLREFRQLLASRRLHAPNLLARWRDVCADNRSDADGNADVLLTPNSRLLVIGHLEIEREPFDEGRIVLFHDGRDLCSMDSVAESLIQELHIGREFTAGDASRWAEGLEWSEVQGFLREGCKAGFLKPLGKS